RSPTRAATASATISRCRWRRWPDYSRRASWPRLIPTATRSSSPVSRYGASSIASFTPWTRRSASPTNCETANHDLPDRRPAKPCAAAHGALPDRRAAKPCAAAHHELPDRRAAEPCQAAHHELPDRRAAKPCAAAHHELPDRRAAEPCEAAPTGHIKEPVHAP